MKIGLIGSGNVGSTLGNIWGRTGHQVFFSSRRPEDLKGLAQSIGSNAHYGTPAEAVRFGDVVTLAVPWWEMKNALSSAGSLEGKVLIDCINPLRSDYSDLDVGFNTSGAEEVSKMATGARVVKAFNTVFADVVRSGSVTFDSQRATGFYCGDDDRAKAIVFELIRDVGLEPVDAGPLRNARYLEPMAMLLVKLRRRHGTVGTAIGPDIAYSLLRR
jgi:8-hydroxy-5-deazaflavin:NADPH oxidoreductase